MERAPQQGLCFIRMHMLSLMFVCVVFCVLFICLCYTCRRWRGCVRSFFAQIKNTHPFCTQPLRTLMPTCMSISMCSVFWSGLTVCVLQVVSENRFPACCRLPGYAVSQACTCACCCEQCCFATQLQLLNIDQLVLCSSRCFVSALRCVVV